MAEELGAFPLWEPSLERKNPFLLRIKEEEPHLYNRMKIYGRRNISLLTTAPAGSVSIETMTTSGIEPCFQISYKRRKKINQNDEGARVDYIDQTGDKWQEFEIYHPTVKKWMEITGETDVTKSPWYGCCADDINWKNRVKLQAAANRHVDHSISSTVNLPEDVTVEEVAKIYETAWEAGCKGITVYRKNCRTGVLVDNTKEEKTASIPKTDAPKRPKILKCDVYHTTSRGQQYFVLVGLYGDEPYEVFAGKNGNIKRSIKSGNIKKMKRGNYALLEDNGEVVLENICDHIDDEQETVTRMISFGLRHGGDVSFVVHQLEKTRGDLLSFSKALGRVLKKYIPDDTKVHGDTCKECHSELVRVEGCVTCKSCGWSRC
jgi:ribonucleoside-diphosphate reductase alpha chain